MTKEEALKRFNLKMKGELEFGMTQTAYIKLAVESMAEVMAEAIEEGSQE